MILNSPVVSMVHVSPPSVRAVVDTLSQQIAIIDGEGTIIEINVAWRRFAIENGASLSDGVGTGNYLAICRTAIGPERAAARRIGAGIASVLAGERTLFIAEYACNSPTAERWFEMTVTALHDRSASAVIIRHDIAARKLQEKRLRIVAIAFESGEGRMITDTQGRILQVN